MLNLIRLNENKNKINYPEIKSSKHFPSPVRAWNNSIYAFNTSVLNLLPVSNKHALNIIKNYFNVFNKIIEQKVRIKRTLLKLRRISLNNIYVSTGEFKHTNNNLLITLYIFNRQKQSYLIFLKKWYIRTFLSKKGLSKKERNFAKFLYILLVSINLKSTNIFKNFKDHKSLEKNYKFNNKHIALFIKNFKKKLVNRWLTKLLLYFYYKQLIYINKCKLNYTYLQHLKKNMEIIYNKNVQFNLVDVKRFYLNSDILSQSITLKIKRNRKKMLKYINQLKNKIKIQTNKIDLNKPLNNNINEGENNLILYEPVNLIKHLKYKQISGFRIEASGRLTRRHTASRSTRRVVYKGNLLNIDSSYKGLSTNMLKGDLKSNLQFSKMNSNTRIGSFGIKGWISGN